MELNFIKPRIEEAKAKATVHRSSGKIGFSKSAERLMRISEWEFCRIAINSAAESNDTMYIVMINERTDDSLKISRAGEYYYIKAAGVLKEVGVDYTDMQNTYIYDITPIEIEGYDSVFMMKKRVIKRNKRKNG